MKEKDTIVAIATPPGQGALGIVRISGPLAFNVADRFFSGKKKPSEFESHTVHYGRIFCDGEFIDNVLLIKMNTPNTYTGENTIEITCHGGRLVLHKVLTTAVAAGARPAEPGEFTMRAFMSGKMDLVQAEAVQQFIAAESELAFRTASRQLEGRLSSIIEGFRKKLVKIIAEVEASIDFPGEDIHPAGREEIVRGLEELEEGINGLIETYADGRRIREGVHVTIAGRPNVGKSSLLNALLEKDRAIITHIPGTTRDLLHESLIWQGMALQITDTAGIRPSENLIEKEGVRRSTDAIRQADLVLFVIDTSEPCCSEDEQIASSVSGKNHIIVLNKNDLPLVIRDNPFRNQCAGPHIFVSALKNTGMEELKDLIIGQVWQNGLPSTDSAIITNARHKAALDNSIRALGQAKETTVSQLSPEFVALHLREAVQSLEVITGKTTGDEILDEIFSKFCIGK